MAQTNESQEQVTINVETLQPVTRTLMTIGALPTSYLISMTYEEQLLWLQNYLIQTVIPAINNNAEATQEVQDIIMALQDYINDYFNNLDVQEEINNKLEQMAQDGSLTTLIEDYVNPYIEAQNKEISEFKTSVNGQIAHQNAQIQAVESGSPLVASSVQEMTDTTRVYVNTTDGNWYYYNGTEWTIGGVYQSTGIAENSIDGSNIKNKSIQPYKLSEVDEHQQYEIFKYSKIYPKRLVNGVKQDATDFYCTDIVAIEPSTTIFVRLAGIDICDIVQYDSAKQFISNIRINNNPNATKTLSDSAHYVALSYRITDSTNNYIYALNSNLSPSDNFYNIPYLINKDVNYELNSISPFKLKEVAEQPLRTVLKFAEWYPFGLSANVLIPSNEYVLSSLVRVQPGTTIIPARDLVAGSEALLTYKEDKTFRIKGQITTKGYTVPNDCYYVALVINKNDKSNDFLICNSLTDKINIEWLNLNKETKEGITFGDSLWANSQGNYNYPNTPYNQSTGKCIGYDDHLALVGINIDNRAVSGQTIVNGINAIKNIVQSDVKDKDFIIISYGRNDFRTGVPIGTLQNTGTTFDETTYIGCLQKAIEHLQVLNPDLKIIIWTPTQSNANGNGIYNTNADGKKMIDYVNACKEVGELYSCEVVDMYSNCGINMINLQRFTFEGVHLTNDGYTFTAPYYVNKMKNILFE